jgi:hypothetical protein
MRRIRQEVRLLWLGLAVAGLLVLARTAPAQEIVGHRAERSEDEATLVFELADGEALSITLADGWVWLDGAQVGRYRDGGAFEASWRAAVEQAAGQETAEAVESVRRLEVAELHQFEIAGVAAIAAAMEDLGTDDVTVSTIVADTDLRRSNTEETVTAAIEEATAVAEAVAGAVEGIAVETPAAPQPPAPTQRYIVTDDSPSLVGGWASGLLSLLATYLGLAFMGLGFLFLAPRQLETVGDTVWHSFWRSFLAGLFAQPLLLPVFGMLMVGLALTVVGIVILPFAVAAFAVGLVLAVTGGYIALARTVGEIYLRRRMAQGEAVATWGSFRYIVYGLMGLLAIWLPAVALRPVPVAGEVALIIAIATTWVLATAGFGAAILSRGGIRGTFVRRLDLALTDEQFWTTDQMPSALPRDRVARR